MTLAGGAASKAEPDAEQRAAPAEVVKNFLRVADEFADAPSTLLISPWVCVTPTRTLAMNS